jgi:hypothetical protein
MGNGFCNTELAECGHMKFYYIQKTSFSERNRIMINRMVLCDFQNYNIIRNLYMSLNN